MVFGDKPPPTIASINSCVTVRLMDATGRSPKGVPFILVELSHVSMHLSQSATVEGATSRFLTVRSHLSAAQRNVGLETDAMDACKVSGLSAPLAAMSSLALSSRADLLRYSGPEVGQIFSRL